MKWPTTLLTNLAVPIFTQSLYFFSILRASFQVVQKMAIFTCFAVLVDTKSSILANVEIM